MGITGSGISPISPVRGVSHQVLNQSIEKAAARLQAQQHDEGYWCYELEADCTIPAEYILMMHFMDEIDEPLQVKLAAYVRARQTDDGGWPLYYGGKSDISCTVKAYYALKLAGDHPSTDHMQQAKNLILSMGGAAKSNVFTRIALAMFQQIPWRGVPFIPVEIMFFPKWFPFHLLKVSYWSRTVMVPLFILCSLKACARNPLGIGIEELFVTPPDLEKDYFPVRSPLNRMVNGLERIGFNLERFIPGWIRKKAYKKAEAWIVERLNGESGLGAIFPAMVNAYEALALLGYAPDHPYRKTAKLALEKLLVIREDDAYCQPCVSPIWDTLIAACALQEAAAPTEAITNGLDWLKNEQLLETSGDWSITRPNLEPGGWPFQFKNDHYPDLDDTALRRLCHAKIGRAEIPRQCDARGSMDRWTAIQEWWVWRFRC